jgi:hypothetical protein
MTKMYNEPEFKVVNMTSEDVLTASSVLPQANPEWDTNGDEVGFTV